MDTIIPEDISYLNFFNDKNHLLLQNGHDGADHLQETALAEEPIFAEYVDGGDNPTWTIGGLPVYLNGPSEEPADVPSLVEPTDSQKAETVVDTDAMGFPIEIPGKGFLTSSGLFFSNEVLLQLNLQQNIGEVDLEKSQDVKREDENKSVSLQFSPESTTVGPTLAEQTVDSMIEIVSMHNCKKCSALFERYEDVVAHVENVCRERPTKRIETRSVLLPSKKREANSVAPKVQKMSSLLNKNENKTPVVKDIFLCGMCENVGYESLENLKKHMLSKHNLTYNGTTTDQKSATSADSEKPKASKVLFQNIVNKQQAEGKKVKCLVKGCDSRFSRIELMMRHHECHVDGEKKKFKCPECDKVFFIWRLCSAHLWKCHKIDIGLYTCTICNSFKSLSPHNLMVHMAGHDSGATLKPFLCAVCGKAFSLLSHLRSHESVHKQPNDLVKWTPTKKTCTVCNRVFSNSKILKKHVQAVHNKYKPFICNICGHQCARKAMLELHLRQHTGEKPYKCNLCDYKTGDHNSMRRHTSRHYGTTKYSCPHCNYTTIQSISYKTHIKRKHPGKDGFFSCVICSFDTVSETLYNDHLKVHTAGLLNGVPMGQAIGVVPRLARSLDLVHSRFSDPIKAKIADVDPRPAQRGHRRRRKAKNALHPGLAQVRHTQGHVVRQHFGKNETHGRPRRGRLKSY